MHGTLKFLILYSKMKDHWSWCVGYQTWVVYGPKHVAVNYLIRRLIKVVLDSIYYYFIYHINKWLRNYIFRYAIPNTNKIYQFSKWTIFGNNSRLRITKKKNLTILHSVTANSDALILLWACLMGIQPADLQDGDWNSAAYYLLLRGVGSSAL
jgi:hypothetical protein